MSLEFIARDEVASCWKPPPPYVPRRIPAALGLFIPVPPRFAASVPVQLGIKLRPFEFAVMESPMFASEEVANVMVLPVVVAQPLPSERIPEPLPLPIQFPFIAKHPPTRLMPLPWKVDVAVLEA